MDVTELTQDQLDELKNSYFYNVVEHNYSYVNDIPNKVIFKHYKGINFVNDDFFCTAGKEVSP